jgi:hypothetical protein
VVDVSGPTLQLTLKQNKGGRWSCWNQDKSTIHKRNVYVVNELWLKNGTSPEHLYRADTNLQVLTLFGGAHAAVTGWRQSPS